MQYNTQLLIISTGHIVAVYTRVALSAAVWHPQLSLMGEPVNTAFPVQQQSFNRVICQHDTAFSVAVFADYVLIIVSQTGSQGTLLKARC